MASYFKPSFLFLVGLLLTALLLNASEALANHASEKEQTRNRAIFDGEGIAAGHGHGRKLLQVKYLSDEAEIKVAQFTSNIFGVGGSKVKDFFNNAGNQIANAATTAWNGMKNAAKAVGSFFGF
ncbi:hypothetical protein Scep_002516 [Stephania cephalantha]|uniref:Uncharacterized protein n=1 Tax=Stephania cephalantha TaxID=152367 RepID=A0AAP0LCV0_9MAGN